MSLPSSTGVSEKSWRRWSDARLDRDTLVIFTSDNGPVVDDGYRDDAAEKLGDHRPAGPWRGGKYSNFEGGTRVPLIVWWPSRVGHGQSSALVSQVDLLASLAALVQQQLPPDAAPDSMNVLDALLGESPTGRDHLVQQAGVLSLRQGRWKLIEPGTGAKINRNTNTELGNDSQPQLFDLADDPGETVNLATQHPDRVRRVDGADEPESANKDAAARDRSVCARGSGAGPAEHARRVP